MGAIIFTTLIAFGLIIYVVRANASEDGAKTVARLGGTTALLLLCVFTVVNIALLVLRRQTVDHEHFRHAHLPAVPRCGHLLLPGRSVGPDREQHESVQDRGRACWPSASCSGRSPG